MPIIAWNIAAIIDITDEEHVGVDRCAEEALLEGRNEFILLDLFRIRGPPWSMKYNNIFNHLYDDAMQ